MSFFKTLLATIIGFFISIFLLFLIMVGIVASSSTESEPFIRQGTVLSIPVSGIITERASDDPFAELFDRTASNRLTMDRLRSNIRKAKSDSRVAGIRLDLANTGGSFAHLVEIRDLLLDFKESGKFIYAYIDDRGANEAAYFIATAADSIFAQPETYLEMDGFYIESSFYKNTFAKYGLQADVITTGNYKTAASTFTEEGFTSYDREQIGEILEFNTQTFVQAVSEFSGLSVSEINAIMNSSPNILVRNAYERGFLSALKFESDFEAILKERTGNTTLRTVSLGRYNRVSDSKAGLPSTPRNTKEIAIVYAEGPLLPDMGSDIFSSASTISYNSMKKTLDELLENDNVAAIVVRVNSPGGAVTTSEAVKNLFKRASEKKPLFVSMGTVASSGGYYIAMGADSVFAEPNTITGSIGVVLSKLSFGDALEQNFAVTNDQIRSHQNADWFSPLNTLTAQQRRGLERIADETYQHFLTLVADARGMDIDAVHAIGQGRIWTGQAAFEVGLVDGLATLPEVVRAAADKAGIDQFIVGTYPKSRTFIENLLDTGDAQIRSLVRMSLGISPSTETLLRDIRMLERPQAYSILSVDFSVN
ncbi:MAG: signal peptide peptidase SppA [Bacteroidetes bacterium]|nr:signal peptide peptidase SppA [Bacteroidota bacterium]